jgi:hypothetical protein
MRPSVALVLLAACAGSPVRADPVPAATAPPPVSFGSEDPEAQGGTWVPPELRDLVHRLESGPARPTSVTFLPGTAAAGCQEAWRFRLIYGAADRFANVSGFRSADAAASCDRTFVAAFAPDPPARERLAPLRAVAGPFFVSFTGSLAGEAALRGELLRQLATVHVRAATPLPAHELPAGARADFRPPPRSPPPPRCHP